MHWIYKGLIVIVSTVLVLPAPTASASTFAGQNGRIAFSKADGGVWTVRQNGSRAQLLSTRTASGVAWSPNGSQIALVEARPNGTTRLQVMDVLSGATRIITPQTDISDSEPAWSYDGSRIAFVRTKQEPGGKQSALYTVRATGDDPKNVSGWSASKSYRVPSWAPDKLLAYEEITSNSARILIKNLSNGNVRELTELSDVSHSPLLAWSPSGKKLLFNDSDGQIYTIWSDGTHRAVISDGDSYRASWSPDGSRIAFLEDFSGESISISEPDGTIRSIPLDISGYSHADAPIWSPDGKQLVFVATRTSTGKKDLFSVDVSGAAQPRKIAANLAEAVAWQAVAK